jgi:hypothetical protein
MAGLPAVKQAKNPWSEKDKSGQTWKVGYSDNYLNSDIGILELEAPTLYIQIMYDRGQSKTDRYHGESKNVYIIKASSFSEAYAKAYLFVHTFDSEGHIAQTPNIVIFTHGGGRDILGDQSGVLLTGYRRTNGKLVNERYMYSVDVKTYLNRKTSGLPVEGGSYASIFFIEEYTALSNIFSLIKDDGCVVFMGCGCGDGSKGDTMANGFFELSGKRLNLFLNQDYGAYDSQLTYDALDVAYKGSPVFYTSDLYKKYYKLPMATFLLKKALSGDNLKATNVILTKSGDITYKIIK